MTDKSVQQRANRRRKLLLARLQLCQKTLQGAQRPQQFFVYGMEGMLYPIRRSSAAAAARWALIHSPFALSSAADISSPHTAWAASSCPCPSEAATGVPGSDARLKGLVPGPLGGLAAPPGSTACCCIHAQSLSSMQDISQTQVHMQAVRRETGPCPAGRMQLQVSLHIYACWHSTASTMMASLSGEHNVDTSPVPARIKAGNAAIPAWQQQCLQLQPPQNAGAQSMRSLLPVQ